MTDEEVRNEPRFKGGYSLSHAKREFPERERGKGDMKKVISTRGLR